MPGNGDDPINENGNGGAGNGIPPIETGGEFEDEKEGDDDPGFEEELPPGGFIPGFGDIPYIPPGGGDDTPPPDPGPEMVPVPEWATLEGDNDVDKASWTKYIIAAEGDIPSNAPGREGWRPTVTPTSSAPFYTTTQYVLYRSTATEDLESNPWVTKVQSIVGCNPSIEAGPIFAGYKKEGSTSESTFAGITHSHGYTVDELDSGEAWDADYGPNQANHSHNIVHGVVLPSETTINDDHTHTLELRDAPSISEEGITHCWPPSPSQYNNFKIPTPELLKENQMQMLGWKGGFESYVKTEFDYNFYVKQYEEGILQISEELLPNQYLLILGSQAADNASETEYKVESIVVDLYNKSPGLEAIDKRVIRDVVNATDTSQDPFIEYIDNISKLPDSVKTTADNKMTNVIFPLSSTEILKEGTIEHFSFPMSINTIFNTERDTALAQALKDSDLSTSLISFMKDIFLGSDPSLLGSTSVAGTSYPSFDLFAWWNKFFDGSITINTDNQVYMGNLNEETIVAENIKNKFNKIISLIVFAGKLKELIGDHLQSLTDIEEGVTCHSEVVCYKISKFEVGPVTISPSIFPNFAIQNFWFPNSNEIDVIKFYDTQVKYNKNYRYEISAYTLIVGTEYTPVETKVIQAGHKRVFATGEFEYVLPETLVKYTLVPTVKILEVPYLGFSGKIIDDPPIAPEVQFYPYRGINDKILILLNTASGEQKLIPIVFSTAEQEIINEIRQIKNIDAPEPITYSSDEGTDVFEVYRMEKPPKDYQEFSDKLVYSIDPRATSTSVVDRIVPNQEYYYTFRAIDFHGKYSNPSPVYKVIVVDNSNATYPEIGIYNFESQKGMPTKNMKKLFRIVPAIGQVVVNNAKVDFINPPELGVKDEGLFGKEFKIRLTSKKTGKQIDFNVNFSTKHIE